MRFAATMTLLALALASGPALGQAPPPSTFSGGTLTSELVLATEGVEFQETDALTDCSTFAATGGGIFFDDSEGVLKKCEDNVLSTLDTTGAGAFSDSADPIVQNTTTKSVVIGPTHNNTAKLSIDGDADETILSVQGNATQTANICVMEQSDGTDLFTLSNAGNAVFAGSVTATTFSSSATTDPEIAFYDADATDGDKNARVYAQATDTGSGTEDVDVTIASQTAGTEAARIFIDADGLVEIGAPTGAAGYHFGVKQPDGDYLARMGSNGLFIFNNATASVGTDGIESIDIYREDSANVNDRFGLLYSSTTAPLLKSYAENIQLTVESNGDLDFQAGLGDEIVFSKPRVDNPDAETCADSGDGNPGALTIGAAPNLTSSVVHITNSDVHGCDITLSESGIQSGQDLMLIVVSTAGSTVNFADTAGVSETEGALALGLWDVVRFSYAVDRWVQSVSVVNN